MSEPRTIFRTFRTIFRTPDFVTLKIVIFYLLDTKYFVSLRHPNLGDTMTKSGANGWKSQSSPNSGNGTAQGRGVHCEVEG